MPELIVANNFKNKFHKIIQESNSRFFKRQNLKKVTFPNLVRYKNKLTADSRMEDFGQ